MEQKGKNNMTITLIDGNKITANKSKLNEIALGYSCIFDYYKKDGFDDLAENALQNCKIIHDALEKTGYYNFDK